MTPGQQYNNDLIVGLSAQALGYLHEAEPSTTSQEMARKFVLALQRLAIENQSLDKNSST